MATPQLQPKDIVRPDDLSTWELAWTKGVTPWDYGDIQPPLKEAIERSGIDFPKSGRALVPGCGSGHDLPYISATLGLHTLGLEVADTAIARAKEIIANAKAQNPKISASIETTDFFTFDPPKDQLFDLIYDHTFFVAIPPAMRVEWGKQMNKLVKPGGHLITLVYPIIEYTEEGPPYFVRPDHYTESLGNGFEKILDKLPEVSSPRHEGKERLFVWKRV